MFSAKNFFSPAQLKEIEAAIQSAEGNTSGEIRIHIENHCKGEPLPCAMAIFQKLGMHKTALRNGVLFFVAVKDRKFAVAGDEAIDKHVPAGFWEEVRNAVLEKFGQEKFVEGICKGIAMTGTELKKYFPAATNDRNELSNDVIFGNK